ncbi:MAG: cupin domain-containing protein [Candidatus Palauibacterales bacterium]|nr:cupin domain-containing protein [Candidatus Palauibacterales bacterium]MDP2528801.1 cupin domain-containing protein [Candidatus Palauibacterales bacterium]
MDARDLIERLGLEPHPAEGGHFRETYRSARRFEPEGAYGGDRSVSTAIYYLLTPDTFSALHRLPGDEIFHFYLGDPVDMLLLHPDGTAERITLGPDLGTMRVQHVVRGGTWQGSRLAPGGRWALLGTTMAPGFEPEDYEAGTPDVVGAYPGEADAIRALLPGGGGVAGD